MSYILALVFEKWTGYNGPSASTSLLALWLTRNFSLVQGASDCKSETYELQAGRTVGKAVPLSGGCCLDFLA
jgi:hypothetical protein